MANHEDAKIQKHLFAVGRTAATWAKLEFALNDLIWELANVGVNEGACITAQIMSSSSRMRALISLADLRGANKEMTSALNKFSARVDGLARQRNRVVHDPWLIDETGIISQVEVTADKKLVIDIRPTKPEEIEEVGRKINSLTQDFFVLRERLLSELPDWPKNQYDDSRKSLNIPRGNEESGTE